MNGKKKIGYFKYTYKSKSVLGFSIIFSPGRPSSGRSFGSFGRERGLRQQNDEILSGLLFVLHRIVYICGVILYTFSTQ